MTVMTYEDLIQRLEASSNAKLEGYDIQSLNKTYINLAGHQLYMIGRFRIAIEHYSDNRLATTDIHNSMRDIKEPLKALEDAFKELYIKHFPELNTIEEGMSEARKESRRVEKIREQLQDSEEFVTFTMTVRRLVDDMSEAAAIFNKYDAVILKLLEIQKNAT